MHFSACFFYVLAGFLLQEKKYFSLCKSNKEKTSIIIINVQTLYEDNSSNSTVLFLIQQTIFFYSFKHRGEYSPKCQDIASRNNYRSSGKNYGLRQPYSDFAKLFLKNSTFLCNILRFCQLLFPYITFREKFSDNSSLSFLSCSECTNFSCIE